MRVRRALVRQALAPLGLRLLRRKALREYAVLRAMERADPALLRSRQESRLREAIRWAYETVPHYRRVLDAAGVSPEAIRGIADLPRLPVLTRLEVKANPEELLSRAAPPRDRLPAVSSGTTSTPLAFYRDRRTVPFDQASMWQALGWAGVTVGDPMLILMLRPSHPGRKRGGMWWHRLTGTAYFPIESLYSGDARVVLDVLRRTAPVVLYGYPGLLGSLARIVLDAPRPVRLPLRCVFYSAEHMSEDTRDLVTQAFGVPIFSRYGATEFPGAVAQTCAHGRWHITTEGVIVEAGSGAPGERSASPAGRGRLLVTDLRSRVMPFLRYEIGDLGSVGEEFCPCGRTGPLLASLDGRTQELAVTPTGHQIPALILQRYMRLHKELIWEYQFQQATPERLDVVVVPRGTYGAEQQEALRRHLASVLGPEIAIQIVPRPHIPYDPSGKRPVLKRLDEPPAAGP